MVTGGEANAGQIGTSEIFDIKTGWTELKGWLISRHCTVWLKKGTQLLLFFLNCLPNEYFDSIKGRLSDSYSVIGQV